MNPVSFVSGGPIAVISQVVFQDSIKTVYGCQGIFWQFIKEYQGYTVARF
ncbi:MAG: hypothetical protein OXC39_06810 [Candidatus Dadabacteria bacterium]|nr:hypothetical protein [Candidatus Dadabacteria bacterium]